MAPCTGPARRHQAGGKRYQLRAGIEATNQVYRPDYGIPALGGRPVDIPSDRQLGEPFGNSTTNNRLLELHADVALTDAMRLAVDATYLRAHAASIRNVLNGVPLAGQPAGTYARSSALEPDTRRRINSLPPR
jgi:iron complex outermembrane recepter protein